MEPRLQKIEEKIDKLHEKLDSYQERIASAETSIQWLKGHLKVSTSIILAIFGAILSFIIGSK